MSNNDSADQQSGTAVPYPLVARLLADFCQRHDLKFVPEPDIGHAGYVEAPNGRRSYFKGTHFDLNSLGGAEIARDKAYTAHFLAEAGFQVPRGVLVSAPRSVAATRIKNLPHADKMAGVGEAVAFAETAGFPLFVKPNDAREGQDVLRVTSLYQLETALTDLFLRHDNVLVQEAVPGRDLRVLVLKDEVLCVIERWVPDVIGDGDHSIEDLLQALPGRTRSDQRILAELFSQGLSLKSVPVEGQRICLLPNANLSAGGMGRVVTDELCDTLKAIAISSGQTLGLTYYGVDMLAVDPSDPAARHAILEINAAPGLSQFYRQGAEEAALTEQVYEKVFGELKRKLAE